MAAVLAGVLFGVIVTIKEWNRESPKPRPAILREQIEVSTMDFGQPELAPPANANFDLDPQNAPLDTVQDQDDQETGNTLQGIVPAGMTTFDTGPSPESTTNSAPPVGSATIPSYSAGYAPTPVSDQPVAPDAAGYADGADQASGSYGELSDHRCRTDRGWVDADESGRRRHVACLSVSRPVLYVVRIVAHPICIPGSDNAAITPPVRFFST